MRVKAFLLALAVSCLTLIAPNHKQAYAATPNGLTVSPAYQMVTIQPGASQQPITFTLTNNLPTAQDINLSVQDFNSLNDSGGLFFVGTNPTALQKKYGLAKWLSLPQSHLTLAPKQTVTIVGTIFNLPDLSPGGHYGALMISLGGQAASGNVGVRPIASSLLFVTKPQGAVYSLNLSSVTLNKSLIKLPTNAELRFYNAGNTHLVPRGIVSLLNGRGAVVAKGIINENSQIILPQNYRQYSVGLKRLSSAGTLGKYSIKVDFRFDGLNQFRSYKATLWYISKSISIGLLIALLIFAYIKFIYGKNNRFRH